LLKAPGCLKAPGRLKVPGCLAAPGRLNVTGHLRVNGRRRVGPVTILSAAIAAAALAGCGSSGGGGGGEDPARAVPASASLYAGATVRPTGSLKTAALDAGHALTHQTNPYLRLTQLLQTPGSPPLSFSRDVAPWLGPQAGVFLTSAGVSSKAQSALLLALIQGLGGSGAGAFPFSAGAGAGAAQGAVVLDTTDSGKARSFLNAQAAHAGAHAATYRGVSYQVSPAGVAFALVGRFAVLGSDSGVRAVIETDQGGSSLARSSGYAKLLADAPAGTLAHVYANAAPAPASGAPTLTQLLVGSREANISLVPASGSLTVDADSIASGPGAPAGGLLAAGADGAQALSELPSDSWLAFGLGHVGATLGEDVRALRALASLGSSIEPGGGESGGPLTINLKGLLEGLLTPLGVLGAETGPAQHAFRSWMGSGGIFASGSNLLELRGAVVISSSNRAQSQAAVAALGAQLRRAGQSVQPTTIAGTDAAVGVRASGLPVTLVIASGVDSGGHPKFVLALGEASVAAALHPSATLAGAASTRAAQTALGEGIQPNLILDVPTLLSLLEGVGLTEGPALAKVLPYLRAITTVSGGTHSLGGGVQRARVVLGLR
jgi:hypothetical protein